MSVWNKCCNISQKFISSAFFRGNGKAIFVSKYHITREFKKYTGFTFHQYVMKKKLIYAKHLLREYRSSSAVYSKSGFSSYPHFLKAFKREFGITPKEFLKRDTQKQLVHYEHFEDEQWEWSLKITAVAAVVYIEAETAVILFLSIYFKIFWKMTYILYESAEFTKVSRR